MKVDQRIKEQLNDMERAEIISESLGKYGLIVIADSIESAIDFSNKYAPEHLIIMTKKPKKY